MRNTSRRFALITALATASVLALAAKDGVLLRLQLASGTTELYRVETKMKQTVTLPNGMGDQEVNVATTTSFKIKTSAVASDGSTADVDVTTKLEKVDVDGPAAQMMQMKPGEIVQKGKVDTQGRYKLEAAKPGSAFAAMASAPGTSLSTFLIELPTKAVSIGDSWEIVVPKTPETGNIDQKLTAKLEGEESVDGQDAWVVRVTGAMKADVDTSKLPKDKDAAAGPMGDMKMLMKSTTNISAKGLVSKSSGKTLKLTAKLKLKVDFSLPDMGVNFDSNGDAEYTLTPVKE